MFLFLFCLRDKDTEGYMPCHLQQQQQQLTEGEKRKESKQTKKTKKRREKKENDIEGKKER